MTPSASSRMSFVKGRGYGGQPFLLPKLRNTEQQRGRGEKGLGSPLRTEGGSALILILCPLLGKGFACVAGQGRLRMKAVRPERKKGQVANLR